MNRQSPLQLARRYPSLGLIAIAGVLALLLPSALNVPTSGPTSLAEYAPVPGSGLAGGDLSSLGGAERGAFGIGLGELSEGPRAGTGPGQWTPKLKRCVGNPRRQTEDPLSPPCVAFFDGDNGGAAWRGVSKDEIKLVLHFGELSEANESPILVDYDDPKAGGNLFDELARAYARFFHDRYQTYGRRIHLYGYYNAGAFGDQSPSHDLDLLMPLQPFAVVPLGLNTEGGHAREAASREVIAVSVGSYSRELQQRSGPYLLSYLPDQQDQATMFASFVCQKLAGRNARFSANLGEGNQKRKFGIVFYNGGDLKPLKEHTKRELGDQCGLSGLPEAAYRDQISADYAIALGAMRQAEVTTVLAFSFAVDPYFWGAAAETQNYYPEWVTPGKSGAALSHEDNSQARTFPPRFWANAFGISYNYRRPELQSQFWYQAFREACPSCAEPPADARSASMYDAMNLLFWGIQGAGPRLTPANIDKGLHAIPPRSSPNPSTPAAYFTPGNYSWIKDSMAIWWDATGTEPGGGRGCYKLASEGRRSRPGEWPNGDDDLKIAGAPCQGPT